MEFEPIVSQEEFDARVRSRLARERDKVRAEFADYEDLRASSAESARKLEDATRQLEEMRAQAEARDRADSLREARSRVSRATGVPAELIRGEDEGDMAEFAESVAAWAKAPAAARVEGAGEFSSRASADPGMTEFVNSLFGGN